MELIDRQGLIDTIEEIPWYHVNEAGKLASGANSELHTALYKEEDIFKALEDAPTVDAVPVVYGRWELGKDKKPYCTACGKRALMDCTHEPEVGYGLYYYKKSEICPNCGAKMDGGVEDG